MFPTCFGQLTSSCRPKSLCPLLRQDFLSPAPCTCSWLCKHFSFCTKVLLLDEPTAGMDPCSRHIVWNLLKNRKANCVTVFSTHFMDEADILAGELGFGATWQSSGSKGLPHLLLLLIICSGKWWNHHPWRFFLKKRDVALKDMIRGQGGDGLGLDLMILVVFSNLNDSVIFIISLIY